MQFYLAVLGGSLIYLLLQLNSVYMLPEFNWKTFFKTNWVTTVLNLAIGCILVSIRQELTNLYPITLLSSVILGISGQALIKKITNAFDSNVVTKLGINQ